MSRRMDIFSLLNEGRDAASSNPSPSHSPSNGEAHLPQPHHHSDDNPHNPTSTIPSIHHSTTNTTNPKTTPTVPSLSLSLGTLGTTTTTTTPPTRTSSPVPETVILAPHLQRRQHGRSTPIAGRTPIALVAPLPPIGHAHGVPGGSPGGGSSILGVGSVAAAVGVIPGSGGSGGSGPASSVAGAGSGSGSGGGGALAGLDALVHAASVERSKMEDHPPPPPQHEGRSHPPSSSSSVQGSSHAQRRHHHQSHHHQEREEEEAFEAHQAHLHPSAPRHGSHPQPAHPHPHPGSHPGHHHHHHSSQSQSQTQSHSPGHSQRSGNGPGNVANTTPGYQSHPQPQLRHRPPSGSPSRMSPPLTVPGSAPTHASNAGASTSTSTSMTTPLRARADSGSGLGTSTPRTRISVHHAVQGHHQGTTMSEEEMLRQRYQQGMMEARADGGYRLQQQHMRQAQEPRPMLGAQARSRPGSRSASRTREYDEEILPPSTPAHTSPSSFPGFTSTGTRRTHPRPLSSHTPTSSTPMHHPQSHPRPASSHGLPPPSSSMPLSAGPSQAPSRPGDDPTYAQPGAVLHRQRRDSSSSSSGRGAVYLSEKEVYHQHAYHQLEKERERERGRVRDGNERALHPGGHSVLGGPGVSPAGPPTSSSSSARPRSPPVPPRPGSSSYGSPHGQMKSPRSTTHSHSHGHGHASALPLPPSFVGPGTGSPEMMRRAISSPEEALRGGMGMGGMSGGPGVPFGADVHGRRYTSGVMGSAEEREKRQIQLHPPPSHTSRHSRPHGDAMLIDRPGELDGTTSPLPPMRTSTTQRERSHSHTNRSSLISPPPPLPPMSASPSGRPGGLLTRESSNSVSSTSSTGGGLGPPHSAPPTARPSSSSSAAPGLAYPGGAHHGQSQSQRRRRGSGSPMLPPIVTHQSQHPHPHAHATMGHPSSSAPTSASITAEEAEYAREMRRRERSLSGGTVGAGGDRMRREEAWDTHAQRSPHGLPPPTSMKRERSSSSASQPQYPPASVVSPTHSVHQARGYPQGMSAASTSHRHECHAESLSPLHSLRTLPPIQTAPTPSVKPLSSSSAVSPHASQHTRYPGASGDVRAYGSTRVRASSASREREREQRGAMAGAYESEEAYEREMMRRQQQHAHHHRERSREAMREDRVSEEPPLKRRRSSESSTSASLARMDDAPSHWGTAPSPHHGHPQRHREYQQQQPQRPSHAHHWSPESVESTRDGAMSPLARGRPASPVFGVTGSGPGVAPVGAPAREKDGTLRRPGSGRQSIRQSSTPRDGSPVYPRPGSEGDPYPPPSQSHQQQHSQQRSQGGLSGPGAGRLASDTKLQTVSRYPGSHEGRRDMSPPGHHLISPHHHQPPPHSPTASSSAVPNHPRPHSHGYPSPHATQQHYSSHQEIHISPAFSVKHEDADADLGYVAETRRRPEPLRVVHIPEAEAPFIQQAQAPKRRDREEKQKAREAAKEKEKEKEKAETSGKVGSVSTAGAATTAASKRAIKTRETQSQTQSHQAAAATEGGQAKTKKPVVAVPSSSAGFPPTSTTTTTSTTSTVAGPVPPPIVSQPQHGKNFVKATRTPRPPPPSSTKTHHQDASAEDDLVMALERDLENAGLGKVPAPATGATSPPHGVVPATRPRQTPSAASSASGTAPFATRTIKTTTITINPKPDPDEEDIVDSLVGDILDEVEVAQAAKPTSQTQQTAPSSALTAAAVPIPAATAGPTAQVSSAPVRSGSSDRVLEDLDLDLDGDDGKAARQGTPMDVDGADAADLLEGEVLGGGEQRDEEPEESEAGGETDMDVDDELLSLLDDAPHPQKKVQGTATKATTAPLVAQSEDNEASASHAAKVKPKTSPKAKKGTKASKADGTVKGRSKAAAMARVKNATAPTQPKASSPSPNPSPKKSRPSSPGFSSALSEPPGSRATSAGPGDRASLSAPPDGDAPMDEDQDQEAEDDRLYCICQSRYDENRVMIACDRCDEWYHTSCVSMPDLEVDLVDQFFCPRCIAAYPTLSLKTTYKPRCLRGLQHPNPTSAAACHQPSRGAYSKYCSKACGMKHMQSKINAWTNKGGKKDKLWDNVKSAKKRQGTVIAHGKSRSKPASADCLGSSPLSSPPSHSATLVPSSLCSNDVPSLSGPLITSSEYVALAGAPADAALKKLNVLLDKVVKMREQLKRDMDIIIWREKLLDLAKERAERVGTCGWDQRLCLADVEVEGEFGTSVLDSYDVEDNGVGADQGGGEKMNGVVADGMDGDEDEVQHGEWWCSGMAKCQRHAGWQALRTKDLTIEKRSKEEALVKLTKRERDIRRRIEDTDVPSPPPQHHLNHRQHHIGLNGVDSESVLKLSGGANGRKVNGVGTAGEKQEKKRKTLDE